MKQIRSAALSRHTAPAFTIFGGLERIQLRKLDDFAYRLYMELLALADHVSGRIETSYAVLIALMDFDVAPQSHNQVKPTTQRIRTAIAALRLLGLVKKPEQRKKQPAILFLKVESRVGIIPPARMSNRMSNSPTKPATARATARKQGHEQQDEQQGVQKKRYPPPQGGRGDISFAKKLSTDLVELGTPLTVGTIGTPQSKASRAVLEMRSKLNPGRPRGVIK